MSKEILIREASDEDYQALLEVEKAAFGRDDEAELVSQLLSDASARPFLSLVASISGSLVGHVLFTRASLKGTTRQTRVSILAPLAVKPEAQKQGVGGRLVQEGLRRLALSGIELVFVLGYPRYYGRHGFVPAGRLGLEAPYPIPERHADAWMVQALQADVLGVVRGRVICANAMDRKEYWEE